MRAYDFLTEDKTKLELPDMNVGDEVKVGKFKNRKAEIKGFTTDDHNQPVLKTTKGDQKLFKPRISKLEPDKKLDETFDQPYNYGWKEQSDNIWRGGFATKTNDDVEVNFEKVVGEWLVDFFRDGSREISGRGDAFKIFATVMTMTSEFINIVKPNIIVLAARKTEDGKNSRAKLYTKMVNRFASENGYNFQESLGSNNRTFYHLTRKEQAEQNESI